MAGPKQQNDSAHGRLVAGNGQGRQWAPGSGAAHRYGAVSGAADGDLIVVSGCHFVARIAKLLPKPDPGTFLVRETLPVCTRQFARQGHGHKMPIGSASFAIDLVT
jgi:hypothetical protein